MKVVFSFYAQKEFEDSTDYYELQSPGLGERFKKEVKHAISRIKAVPPNGDGRRDQVLQLPREGGVVTMKVDS